MAIAEHNNHSFDRRKFLRTTAVLTSVSLTTGLLSACENLRLSEPKTKAPVYFADPDDRSGNKQSGYLTLPFRKNDLTGNPPYELTEGFTYSAAETAMHGMTDHKAVDLDVPYGTPLLAPVAKAYAVASYQTLWADKDPNGRPRTYQDKEVRIGFGNFVELRDTESNRILQLAHLSALDPRIPFHDPKYNKEEDSWDPTIFNLPTDELVRRGLAVLVKRGQELGAVGYSGLMWGRQIDYAQNSRSVILPQAENQSYDDPHVHLELAERNQSRKSNQIDPYDIYSQADKYPSPTRPKLPMGSKHVWRLKDGLPDFSA